MAGGLEVRRERQPQQPELLEQPALQHGEPVRDICEERGRLGLVERNPPDDAVLDYDDGLGVGAGDRCQAERMTLQRRRLQDRNQKVACRLGGRGLR